MGVDTSGSCKAAHPAVPHVISPSAGQFGTMIPIKLLVYPRNYPTEGLHGDGLAIFLSVLLGSAVSVAAPDLETYVGTDISGADLDCGQGPPKCRLCGDVTLIAARCRELPNCVAYAFDQSCGWLKTAREPRTAREGFTVHAIPGKVAANVVNSSPAVNGSGPSQGDRASQVLAGASPSPSPSPSTSPSPSPSPSSSPSPSPAPSTSPSPAGPAPEPAAESGPDQADSNGPMPSPPQMPSIDRGQFPSVDWSSIQVSALPPMQQPQPTQKFEGSGGQSAVARATASSGGRKMLHAALVVHTKRCN